LTGAGAADSTTLNATTLAADFAVYAETLSITNGVTLANGATVTLTGGTGIQFQGPSETLTGTGQIIFNGTHSTGGDSVNADGPLLIGPNVAIRSGTIGGGIGAAPYSLTNQGLISAETPTFTIRITSNSFAKSPTRPRM